MANIIWIKYLDFHTLALKATLPPQAKSKRKQRWLKKMWKNQVEKESKGVGLEKEGAMNWARWRVRVAEIIVKVG